MKLPVRPFEALDGTSCRPAIHHDAAHQVFGIVLVCLAEHDGNCPLSTLFQQQRIVARGIRRHEGRERAFASLVHSCTRIADDVQMTLHGRGLQKSTAISPKKRSPSMMACKW